MALRLSAAPGRGADGCFLHMRRMRSLGRSAEGRRSYPEARLLRAVRCEGGGVHHGRGGSAQGNASAVRGSQGQADRRVWRYWLQIAGRTVKALDTTRRDFQENLRAKASKKRDLVKAKAKV